MDKDLVLSFGNLSVSKLRPENSLPLQSRTAVSCNELKFTDHKLIGKYTITKDLDYDDKNVKNIPKIINESEIRSIRGKFLGDGYRNAVLVEDYNAYHELKQEYFLRWLDRVEYFEKVKKGQFKKPDVICFGGRITDPLQSPLQDLYGQWDMFGTKFMDTVFLWDIKESHRQHSIESFYGVAYEALLTGTNPKDVNEHEKPLWCKK